MGSQDGIDPELLGSTDDYTPADYIDIAGYMQPLWHGHATENVEKWGLQSEGELLLATMEELGEMAAELNDAYEVEGDDVDCYSVTEMLREIERLGKSVQTLHEDIYEDEDGNAVGGPTVSLDGHEAAFADELNDTVALLYQIRASLDRRVIEDAASD